MHPPPFNPDHLLSDWPDCRLEVRCPKCRHTAFIPIAIIRAQHGDRSFRRVLAALRCGQCEAVPAPVYLLAGETRVHCYGGPPGWAIELVKSADQSESAPVVPASTPRMSATLCCRLMRDPRACASALRANPCMSTSLGIFTQRCRPSLTF